MRRSVLAFTAAGLALAVLAAVPAARSQMLASPSYVPIGVSASGQTSTAWFHDPHGRQAIACQTVVEKGGTPGSVQCVAGKLP